jgi:hypothetical protein
VGGGRDRVRTVGEASTCIKHMRRLLPTAYTLRDQEHEEHEEHEPAEEEGEGEGDSDYTRSCISISAGETREGNA